MQYATLFRSRAHLSYFTGDIYAGLAVVVLLFPGAIAVGGFNFVLPWLLLNLVLLFLAGLVRSQTEGGTWAKAATINAPAWVVLIVIVRTRAWWVIPSWLVAGLLSTVIAIALRRTLGKKKRLAGAGPPHRSR